MRVAVLYDRGFWTARADDLDGCRGRGDTRDECLTDFTVKARKLLGPHLTLLIEEEPPSVVGVTEVADILGWDRRKVGVYAHRGRLPTPIANLVSGRIWLRADIEAYKAERTRTA